MSYTEDTMGAYVGLHCVNFHLFKTDLAGKWAENHGGILCVSFLNKARKFAC